MTETRTQRMIKAVFEELAEQREQVERRGYGDGYTCSDDPILEAECAWIGTGNVWTGYQQKTIEYICKEITAQVTLSLAVGGYLREVPE